MTAPCSRRGITLPELLVAITIIAILAALGFSALGKAMELIRADACLGNLRQTLIAWEQCATDNPVQVNPGQTGAAAIPVQTQHGNTWAEVLTPYVDGNTEGYECPDQLNDAGPGYGMNPLIGAIWYYPLAGFKGGYLLTPDDPRAKPISMVFQPSQTVLFADTGCVSVPTKDLPSSQWVEEEAPWRPYTAYNLTDTTSGEASAFGAITHGYDWGSTVPSAGVGSMGWNERMRAVPRHRENATAGFVDLHVKQLRIGDLTDPQWGAPDCLFDNQQ